MKYIEVNFLKALTLGKELELIKDVNDKIPLIKKTLNTELARAANKEIHIIGMIHETSHEVDPKAVISQNEVVRRLKEISPDIVGWEGFTKGKFSLPALVNDLQGIFKTTFSPTELSRQIVRIENDPQINPMINYYKSNPDIQFCGVDHQDLQRLQVFANRYKATIIQRGQAVDLPMAILHDGALRLRSLFMIAKITQRMKNFNRVKAALPIGFKHLIEIIELKNHLNAREWYIYDAREPLT